MKRSSPVRSERELAVIVVQLGDFRFESVSLPPELEKALDENTRLNMMRGNIDIYTQMAQADAMKEAAKKLEFERAAYLRDKIKGLQ